MTVKKLIGKVHLWLGFSSGLIVFVIAITGCILAFQVEIENATKPYLHAPTRTDVPTLPPSVLKEIAMKHVPEKKFPKSVNYFGKDKSVSVMFYDANPDYYYQIYMDPYTGKVLKVWSETSDFFHLVVHGHYNLWLPTEIGRPIVATATLIFVIMLISGMILWWPKNKGAAKQRFSIKWDAKWRRVNYDLHNVMGFYIMIIAMVLAITGLIWGFDWFSESVYFATSGGKSLPTTVPVSDTTKAAIYTNPEDQVWQQLVKKAPAGAEISVAYPEVKSAAVHASINYRAGTYYKMDHYHYDQQTLAPLKAEGPYTGKYAEVSFANKLRNMNYDIHVGAILGLPGKILMFMVSLICASLPITGIYIWWGRRSKKVSKSVPKRSAARMSA